VKSRVTRPFQSPRVHQAAARRPVQRSNGTKKGGFGQPSEPVYETEVPEGWDPASQLGKPGVFPFQSDVYPTMITARPWTMRRYAMCGTAVKSKQCYHPKIGHGTASLSVGIDLPTQMEHNSDYAIASGEEGEVDMALDSINDMRLRYSIPLSRLSARVNRAENANDATDTACRLLTSEDAISVIEKSAGA